MKVVNKLQTINYGNKHRLSLIKFRVTDVVTPTHAVKLILRLWSTGQWFETVLHESLWVGHVK
jgi:hypothetical protein